MSLVAWSVVVTGRVQGVGFRRFVQRCAQREGVTGWVSNLPNGSVACEAEGAQAAVERFLALVRQGPALARVDRCEVAAIQLQGATDFTIR